MDDAQRSSFPPAPLRVGSDPGSLEFRDFFEREYERLGEALRVLTGGNVPEAEDVAQEAMVRVYERWGRIRGMDSPTGYLYRTALNLYRSRIRRLLRFPKRALAGDVRPRTRPRPSTRRTSWPGSSTPSPCPSARPSSWWRWWA
jgi:DNA-directed RNA polymerase specialized sigma24 family protein